MDSARLLRYFVSLPEQLPVSLTPPVGMKNNYTEYQ